MAAAVVVLAPALTACGSHGAAGPEPVKPGQTVVSVDFDDGTASQWTARPLLSRAGLHATFFLVSGAVGTPGYLDWAQVRSLHADGNEIAGHTVSHPHLAALPADEARREICTGRDTLLEHGYPVTDLAYPYGSYTSAIETIAADCGYQSARTIDGPDPADCANCAHAEQVPPIDAYAVKAAFVPTDTSDLAALERSVTDAESHGGGWVHVVFHRLCEGCDHFSTSPATLGAFLDWLAPRKGSGTVVRTVRQVVGGRVRPAVDGPPASTAIGDANALPNGSLESDADGDGVPDCWSETGYGESSATWSRTAGSRTGATAVHLDVSSLVSGDRKLVLTQDLGACTPTPVAGTSYRVGAVYQATADPIVVAFYRDRDGRWTYWSESPPLAPASGWTDAAWTTPPAPDGATGLSVGVLLKTPGSLSIDDFSLVADRS